MKNEDGKGTKYNLKNDLKHILTAITEDFPDIYDVNKEFWGAAL